MKNNLTIKYSLIAMIALTSSIQAAEDLGTITVESSTIDDKFDAKKLEVSNTVTITGDEVEAFKAENLADVLNTVPGVTVRKNEGDSNKIHIRGIGTEMSLIPLRDARSMGYCYGVLCATGPGLKVYRKLGFKEYVRWEWYSKFNEFLEK